MMLMRKAGAIAVALSVGIVAMMAGGCAKKAAATPEAAFLEFQKAMVFNRRQALEKYATKEYIQGLESLFDLIVISANWPSNCVIAETKSVGDKAVIKATGQDRPSGERALGVFKLEKTGGFWMVTAGEWIRKNEFMSSIDEAANAQFTYYVNEISGILPQQPNYSPMLLEESYEGK